MKIVKWLSAAVASLLFSADLLADEPTEEPVTELPPEVTGVDARGFIHLRVEAPEGEAGLFRVILP